MSVDVIKQELLSKLRQEHCFWSYNEDSIKDIPDDMLIEKTLLHLDLEEINLSRKSSRYGWIISFHKRNISIR